MNKQISVGFVTEGSTDDRFLISVIQRSFETIAFDCFGQIEVLPLLKINRISGSFVELVIHSAAEADSLGIVILCVHADADDSSDSVVFNHKIFPAFDAVNNRQDEQICRNLVAVVPIHMTEAWMLADKDLLKDEIGTSKSNVELSIEKAPETYSDPKQIIEDAIRIAKQGLTRRRRHDLAIEELYSQIGQRISLEKLEKLAAYKKFLEAVRDAYRKLNYLR